MILYGVPLSAYCAKVRLALAIKGVAIEWREPPGGYRSAEYRAIVATGTIPALVDGDFVLSESDAIVEYLNELHPDPKLLPEDAKGRARARALSRFHDFYLEPPLRALFGQVDPRMRDPTLVASRVGEIQRRLDQLEMLIDARPYLVGPRVSLADCAFPATLALLAAIMPALGSDPRPGPRLAAWQAQIAADPAFERVLAPYRGVAAWWVRSKIAAAAG